MTLEERCKKFATRNYLNSDGEVVTTIVDEKVYNNALVVAKTVKRETIDKACEWLETQLDNWLVESTIRPFIGEEGINEFRKAMEE